MHWQTMDSITKQIRAMGCAEYELGVLDPKDGKINPKTESPEGRMHLRPRPVPEPMNGLVDAEILTKYTRWLGLMNSTGGKEQNGCHIFIRPFGPTNLTFIDDLKLETTEKMKKDGFQFAVLIESSPNNFHGWLKNVQVLTPIEETTAAKMLCERYGGDPQAASKRRFGRLSGFTNRKDAYFNPEFDKNGAGGYPFVKLREASGAQFDKAEEFYEEVKARVQANQTQIEQKTQQHRQFQNSNNWPESKVKDISYFQQKFSDKGERFAADFQYALHALSNGKSVSEVEHVIRTRSQSSANKGDYPQRTVRSVQQRFPDKTVMRSSNQMQMGR